jgi:UDP-N-acetylglucosamine diphosphorylase/glucosamine-1-phosphate N-acetyltransferase
MDQLKEIIGIIILAAGKGTRMKSDIAKVLHKVSGRPMIEYIVETAVQVAGENVVVVIGNQAEHVSDVVSSAAADVKFAIQNEQKGTGHAVKCAIPVLPKTCTEVVILCGDVPLIKTSTIDQFIEYHIENKNDVSLFAVRTDNPFGYGRVLLSKSGNIEQIVEEADATDLQKQINIINSGIYCVKKDFLEFSVSQLQTNNAQQEAYLTDIIEIAIKSGKKAGFIIGQNPNEILGINTQADLRRVESLIGLV